MLDIYEAVCRHIRRCSWQDSDKPKVWAICKHCGRKLGRDERVVWNLRLEFFCWEHGDELTLEVN